MAANTVLNYLPRKSVIHRADRNYQTGILPALYLCKYDHLQYLGAARTPGSKHSYFQTKQN